MVLIFIFIFKMEGFIYTDSAEVLCLCAFVLALCKDFGKIALMPTVFMRNASTSLMLYATKIAAYNVNKTVFTHNFQLPCCESCCGKMYLKQ